jgi:hypothetical protein
MSEWKHLVVGDVAQGLLRAAFDLDPANKYQGEVRNFRDDLSIGRIDRLMETHRDRVEWFRRITAGTEFGDFLKDYLESAMEENYASLLDFDPEDRIVIWHSGIVSEETTLRFLASRLAGHDLWEVEGLPAVLGFCSPDQVVHAMAGIRPIPREEVARLCDEWSHLAASPARLRIFQDGQVMPVAESHFDGLFLDRAWKGYKSAALIVGDAMGACQQYISDTFFDYRLRTLIRDEKLEAKGNLSVLRSYEVRKRA